MKPSAYWQEFIGDEYPTHFLRRAGCRNPESAVEHFMTRLPAVYGIVLRKSWPSTFASEEQLNRMLVRNGLIAYLEETRADWEQEVADLPEFAVPPAPPVSKAPPPPINCGVDRVPKDTPPPPAPSPLELSEHYMT